MRTLNELLVYQLQYIYNVESRLIEGISMIASNTTDGLLKETFEIQLENTKQHIKKIEGSGKTLEIILQGAESSIVTSFIQEIRELLKGSSEEEVLNIRLLTLAQGIIHFKVSIYYSAIQLTDSMGYAKISEELAPILNQEKRTLSTLSSLTKKHLTRQSNP